MGRRFIKKKDQIFIRKYLKVNKIDLKIFERKKERKERERKEIHLF